MKCRQLVRREVEGTLYEISGVFPLHFPPSSHHQRHQHQHEISIVLLDFSMHCNVVADFAVLIVVAGFCAIQQLAQLPLNQMNGIVGE